MSDLNGPVVLGLLSLASLTAPHVIRAGPSAMVNETCRTCVACCTSHVEATASMIQWSKFGMFQL